MVEPRRVGLEIFVAGLDELMEPFHRRHPALQRAPRPPLIVSCNPVEFSSHSRRQSVVAARGEESQSGHEWRPLEQMPHGNRTVPYILLSTHRSYDHLGV